MRTLQTTLFVIAMLVISTQTLRHVYVRWFEPTGSVLDEFDEPVEKDIAKTKSLQELRDMYAKAHASVKASERGAPLEEVERSRRTLRGDHLEESELRQAIDRLEGQRRDTLRLWFFWLGGLASIVLGVVAYARLDRWLGFVGVLAGFTEMACWTSPLWRSRGPQATFEHLLGLKLALSAVSLAALAGLWLATRRARATPISAGRTTP